MSTTIKKSWVLLLLLALLAGACYSMIAYSVPRSSFSILIMLITGAFISYILMVRKYAVNHFKFLLLLSFLFRLIFLFATPTLSDDYFRFIWDGSLTGNNINPYAFTPDSILQIQGNELPFFMQQLKANMNSVHYYSVYPPVLQFLFFVSVKTGGAHLLHDVIILRIFSLLAETGIVFIAIKLLEHFKLPVYHIFWYALNPLVIIEFTGNLHGDVFMIFLLALTLFFLIKEQLLWSAVALGLAVSAKLLPLIFMPAMVSYLGFRKSAVFLLLTFLTIAATFLPFINAAFIQNITTSLGLYFEKFEFNASIYYLLLLAGYDIAGFNLIYFIGKILPLFSFIFILMIAFKSRIHTIPVLINKLMITLLVYYLFSLVVHPWYITALVFLSVFSSHRFAIAWSALVMLTYSAYTQVPYKEVMWLTALEYILLAVFIYFEFKKKETIIEG